MIEYLKNCLCRLEVLNSDVLEQKRLNDALESDLVKQEEQIETFKKVIVSCS
jgi:hypothetical protein